MVYAILFAVLLSPQGDRQLAIRAAEDGDAAHARYYAHRSVLRQPGLESLARLGEEHEVAWLFFEGDPLSLIVMERGPVWARLARFDVRAGGLQWKAQFYPSQVSQPGSLGSALSDWGLAAVFKAGSRSDFGAAMASETALFSYRIVPQNGELTKLTHQSGKAERRTFKIPNSAALRRLGFP